MMSLSSWSVPLLEGALNGLWQGALVAGAVIVLLRWIPRTSAATRVACFRFVLVAIAGLTILGVAGERPVPASRTDEGLRGGASVSSFCGNGSSCGETRCKVSPVGRAQWTR